MKTKLFLMLLLSISSITFSQITNPVPNNLERSYEFVNGTLTDTKNGVDLVQGAQSTVNLVPDRHGVPNDAVQFSNYPTTSYSQLTATPVGGARKKSFSFWIKTSTNDNLNRHIVNNHTAMVYLRDGKIGAHISGYHKATGKTKTTVAISKISTRTIDDGNWHHVVATLEVFVPTISSNYRTLTFLYNFYIDGVHEAQQTHTQQFYVNVAGIQKPYGYGFNTPSSFNIGKNYEDIVDDIYVYNGILTQAEVTTLYNSIVTIPDANLKNALVNTVDTNYDGEVQVSEASKYTGVLNLNGKNIADLTGIEAFRKVTVLNCSNNQLTSLDLRRNIALTTVDCSGNQITGNVNLSKNKALTSFNISNNNVITLNVANTNNANLTTLNTTTNANLVCISPDAGFTPTASWLKDATASYSDTCFPKLITNVIGDGTITINPISADSTYTYAKSVTLTPNPASASHQFTGWSGDATGTTNPLNITVNSDTNISANFSFTPTIFYVDKNVTGGNNDGSSWANAFATIQEAINASGIYGDEIWIAKGTYTPHTSDKNKSFYINKDNLKIYGGFAGTETQLSQRDMTKIHTDNATILSGDLNNDDSRVAFAGANRTDNSLKVVKVSKENTVLDGLIISDGQGDFVATTGNNRYGAGVFKDFKVRVFTIKNTVVKDNVAQSSAGLMLQYDAYQATNTNAIYTIDKCVFENNLAQVSSALEVSPYGASPNSIAVSITNSLFDSNKTVDYNTLKASGASNGAIKSYYNGTTNVTIVNNTFINSMNDGTKGGDYPALVVSKRLTGVINGVIANNIFWGNKSNNSVSKAIGKGSDTSIIAGSSVFNSIDEDNFSNLTGTVNTSNVNPNLDANFKLQATSLSALNSGSNSKLPSHLTKDLAGNDRVYNGVIDLGAYEFTSGTSTSTAWTGAIDNNWSLPSNWNNGVPTNTLDAFIFNGATNYPVISNSVYVKDITIENLASLKILPSANLTAQNIITGDKLIVESDVNNYGSLKVFNTVTGKVTYKSYVSDKWHLIGSPVVGQEIASFVTNSSLVSGTVNPNHKGLGIYENANANPWTYYKNTLSWGNFDTAKAYAIKKTTAGTVDFTGTVITDNVQYTATGIANNTFEMISNPYTAHLNANSGSNSVLSENLSNLKSTNVALYFWNDTTKTYDVVNNASSPNRLAPGQGFFVQMQNTNGVVNFTPAMLLHQQSSSSRPAKQTAISLTISDEKSKGNISKTTQIKYLSNTNDGLDIGYDAGYFDGGQSKVGVYTKLADGTYSDTDFMLQCVNNEKISATVIPVGIKTSEAREVVFSAKAMNLPENLNIYLEDKENNKVTELSNGGEYKATVSAGSGRFYVHTKISSNLNADNIVDVATKLSVYKTDNSLVINGLEEKSTVVLYNMIGKQVFIQKIENTTKTVSLPSLSTGIYVVKVQSGATQISKKISIQ